MLHGTKAINNTQKDGLTKNRRPVKDDTFARA